MRKLKLFWTVCALMLLGGMTNSYASKTVYLSPGVWSTTSNFAVWAWEDNGTGQWYTMTDSNSDGIYEYTFTNDKINHLIFGRMTSDSYDADVFSSKDGSWWDRTNGDIDGVFNGLKCTIEGWNDGYSPFTTSIYNSSAATLSAGKYLFRNVATGKYLGPANNVGTQASLIEPTYFNTLVTTESTGVYKIESQVSNGGANYYLGLDGSPALYLDDDGDNITINGNGTVFTMSVNGSNYIGYDGTNTYLSHTLSTINSNSVWELIPVNDNEAVSAFLGNATSSSPVEATFLVKDANMDNHTRVYWSGTSLSKGGDNGVSGDGHLESYNYVLERWTGNSDSNFDLYQNLTNLPNGIYKVTCQGFYRAGGDGVSESKTWNAVLYAGNQTSPLMNINTGAANSQTGGYQQQIGSTGTYVPNSKYTASLVFNDGAYSDNSVYAIVSDGNLRIGIKKQTNLNYDWTCFDNVRLYYYGALPSASSSSTVDLTCMINNPSFETGDKRGWTDDSGTPNMDIQDNTYLSGKDGSWFIEKFWETIALDLNQTISTLPSGYYTITARAVAEDGNTISLYAKVGSNDEVTTSVSTENDYSINVYLSSEGSIKMGLKGSHTDQKCVGLDNFRLTYLGDPYPTLNTAINDADASSHTLGFDNGEYAPYNNIDMLQALEEGATIYSAKTATAAEVETAITAITGATWTANVGSVECVYNGGFTIGQGSPAANIQQYGWTRTNGWGQFRDDSDNVSTSNGTSYYNQNGSLQYGNAGLYTMPLKANTVYTLTFKYASWEIVEGTPSNNSVTASVLKSSDGMAAITYGQNATVHTAENAFVTKTIKFVTGAAGDYILTLANSGNTVITDVSITKAVNQYLEFTDGTSPLSGTDPTYAPGTYPSVKITRSLTADRWATAVYPFAVSGVDNIAVLNSFDATKGIIGFTSAAASTANVPFLMRSTSNKSEVSLSNVAVAAASVTNAVVNEASLIGAYTTTNITNAKENYVLSNNTIYNVGDAGATIKPYRAYIQIASSTPSRTLSFFIDNEDINDIEGLSMEKRQPSGDVYNLNGQLIRKNADNTQGLHKGVYVVGGQRIIVK
jgi:hypothetical protein